MGRPKKNPEPAEITDDELVMAEIAKMGAHVMENLDDLACDYYMSTGIWGLDYGLGGGIPSCAVVEIHGDNGVGKSSLGLQICAAAIASGIKPYHFDTEFAVNDKQARIFLPDGGVKWIQPETGSIALNGIKALLKGVKHACIVLDSVGGTVPDAIAEGNVEDAHIGNHAKLFSQFGGTARTYARKHQNMLICLNQETTNISPMSKGGGKPTGGKKWGFIADIRIKLVRKFQNGMIKDSKGSIIGHIIEATITKNRFSAPHVTVDLPLMYGIGFDVERDLIENAVGVGVVEKSGSWFSFGDLRIGHGVAKASEFLRDCPDVKKEILEKLNEIAL